jgi:hypothetical protein
MSIWAASYIKWGEFMGKIKAFLSGIDAVNLEKANELDEKDIPATLSTIASTVTIGQRTTSQPRFWVIKDPREGRRQRLIEVG